MDSSLLLNQSAPLPLAEPSFAPDPFAGLAELDRAFLDEPGVSILAASADLTGDLPIQLEGEDLRRFKHRFERSTENARQRMSPIHLEAKRDRETYIMLPKTPRYEGGPDITTPLSANKVDGVAAHLRDAVEQKPLVTFSPEGVGRAAEEAVMLAPLCEAYIEREINHSNSREVIAGDMPKEVAQVGTGIAELSLTEINGETFIQLGETIRLENFFVDRIKADHLKDVFCFYEKKERQYNLEDLAEAGLYDKEAVSKLNSYGTASSQAQTAEEERYQFNEADTFAEENALRDLCKGWMRFRPKGSLTTDLYEVVMHDPSKTYLSIRKNPAAPAFDAPPLALFRIGKQSGYLFGRGISRRLENEQKLADKYLNNHLAMTDMMGSPPYQYRENSAFGKALERAGKRGLVPGQAIPSQGQPTNGDVAPLQLFTPSSQINLTNMDVAFRFADQASYQEAALGGDSGSRRTLGQFTIETQKGTLRLRSDLADFAYDAALALKMYWSMLVAFKLEPQGVTAIAGSGKLIAAEPIETGEVAKVISEIVEPLLRSGQITPETAQAFGEQYQASLTNNMIPGVRGSNLSLSLTGTRIIADKTSELDLLTTLTPYISSFIQAAAQDSYANYHLRSILRAAGFSDIDKRMPPEPNQTVMDAAARQKLFAPFEQLMSQSSNMV